MCVCICECVYVYLHVCAGAHRSQRKAPDPLELDLPAVLSLPLVWALELIFGLIGEEMESTAKPPLQPGRARLKGTFQ